MKRIIKVYKFPLSLNSTEIKRIDGILMRAREVYNLLNDLKFSVDKWNSDRYYEAHPKKLKQREESRKEWLAKIEQEIKDGKRQPKMKKIKRLTPIQHRHTELATIEKDLTLHLVGLPHVLDTGKIWKGKSKETGEEYDQINCGYVELSRLCTVLRKNYPELNFNPLMPGQKIPSAMWVPICKRVEQAWKATMKNRASGIFNYPSMKGRKDDMSIGFAEGVDNNKTVRLEPTSDKTYKITGLLPKVFTNGIKFRMVREIPPGNINGIKIVKQKNKYYVNISQYETQIEYPPTHQSVGLDYGIVRNIQMSSGEYKNLPVDQMKKLEKRKDRLKSRIDRKKRRGSNNWKKAKKNVAKIDTKIAAIRQYHLRMIATSLVKDYDFISLEDLKTKNMTKSAKGTLDKPGKNVKAKAGLNKAILRTAPFMFKTFLFQKSDEYGRTVVAIDPKYTSQECSECGTVKKENRHNQATFKCVNCGHEMNADHNAAIVILKRGQKALQADNKDD